MSIEIAARCVTRLKHHALAERINDPQDKMTLQQLATKLIEISERLERDARD